MVRALSYSEGSLISLNTVGISEIEYAFWTFWKKIISPTLHCGRPRRSLRVLPAHAPTDKPVTGTNNNNYKCTVNKKYKKNVPENQNPVRESGDCEKKMNTKTRQARTTSRRRRALTDGECKKRAKIDAARGSIDRRRSFIFIFQVVNNQVVSRQRALQQYLCSACFVSKHVSSFTRSPPGSLFLDSERGEA